MDALVRGLNGEEQILEYKGTDVQRKQDTTGTKTITVTTYRTNSNAAAFDLIEAEAVIIYGDDEYIIQKPSFKMSGKLQVVMFDADHRFFADMNRNYVDDKYHEPDGNLKRDTMLAMIFKDTGYTYELDSTGIADTYASTDDWGDDYNISLFNDFISKFVLEFNVTGMHVKMAKELSRKTDNGLFYHFNISDPEVAFDSSSLYTHIKGFGHQLDDGSYVVTSEYTSPMAAKYGKRTMKSYHDNDCTDQAKLDAATKAALTDSIAVTITTTYQTMQDQNKQDLQKGDWVWVVLEPFGINVQLRISEVDDSNNENKSPTITLGTIKQGLENIMSGMANENQIANTNIEKVSAVATKAYNSRIISTTVGEYDG
mgnify:CR=1 FL=1